MFVALFVFKLLHPKVECISSYYTFALVEIDQEVGGKGFLSMDDLLEVYRRQERAPEGTWTRGHIDIPYFFY